MPRPVVGHVPGHAVVAEVRQRMAQRGELPVEHRDDPRLRGMEHHVVQAVVAMDDRNLGLVARARRHMGGKPVDQALHGLDRLRQFAGAIGRGLVLLAPAADLALEVVAGLAVVREAALGELHGVQRRDDAVHLVVDGRAPGVVHAGQGLVPQHAALHELHHVESAADHGFVLAQAMHARHRHAGAGQAAHDLEFALHRMGRGQQLGNRARLGAHHVALRGRDELVGRVRLPALEHLDRQRSLEAVEVLRQPRCERLDVEGMLLRDRTGADEVGEVLAHVNDLLPRRASMLRGPIRPGRPARCGWCPRVPWS